MQAKCSLKLLSDQPAADSDSASQPGLAEDTRCSATAPPSELRLAAAPEPGLPDLVLSRLRELICEAPSGPQLEALVRVAERLPQWHSALRGSADDLEVENLTLEQAVSEVRRIADLAETSLSGKGSQ